MAKKKKKKLSRVRKAVRKVVRKKINKKTKKAPAKKIAKKKVVKKKVRKTVKKSMPRPTTQPSVVAPEASTPPPFTAPAVELKEGDPAPDFYASLDDGNVVSLGDFRGKKVVFYFYPKDDTPGCTREACAFRDGIAQIQARGAVVLGVSADSVESHQKFKEKYSLNFPLLSDPDKKIVQAYGVWKEKNMYGRTYMGIERTTFLIDEQGKIQKIFPKVNVEMHYDEVLAALG